MSKILTWWHSWTYRHRGMTEVALLCSAYDVECCWHIYDANLGFFFNIFFCYYPESTRTSFLVESPATFSSSFSPCCQMHSTPAVRAILAAFYTAPALKRAQQSHGESAANRCSAVWKTPGLRGIIYCFRILCYTVTATVNKQNIHIGEWSSCSSAHILKLQQAVQWCVRVLSCEGKPSSNVQARLSAHVSGRKTQMWSWRQREGGMDGGIRVDVIRESRCACQQWLALAHMPTRTCRYIYSCTPEQSH